MKLIWTKSNSPLSLLIRGITGQDCVLNNVPGFKKIDVKGGMQTPHDVWQILGDCQ